MKLSSEKSDRTALSHIIISFPSSSPLPHSLKHCHDSSFSFCFLLSPVWWVTHVRDSDSPWQHYLTVPQLLTFSGWQAEVSVTYLKGLFHPIQRRSESGQPCTGIGPPIQTRHCSGLSGTPIPVYQPTTSAHMTYRGTYMVGARIHEHVRTPAGLPHTASPHAANSTSCKLQIPTIFVKVLSDWLKTVFLYAGNIHLNLYFGIWKIFFSKTLLTGNKISADF